MSRSSGDFNPAPHPLRTPLRCSAVRSDLKSLKFSSSFLLIDPTFPTFRSVTRLDGARGKKQVGAPCSNLRSFGSKSAAFKKVLTTLLGLFRAPIVIRRPANYAPLPPVVTPLSTFDTFTLSMFTQPQNQSIS